MKTSEWTGKPLKMNELDVYFQCGLRAGRGAKYQDWSLVKFEQDWLGRALHLEQPEYRILARAEYDRGYKEGRGAIGERL